MIPVAPHFKKATAIEELRPGLFLQLGMEALFMQDHEGHIKLAMTSDAFSTENLKRAIIYSRWETRELLEEQRVIPYGIPNEVYYAMLRHQFHPVGKGVLFPEHAEFVK